MSQYHPTVACSGQQAQVTFFDANERNLASLDAARSHSRAVAERVDALFSAVVPLLSVDQRHPIERQPRTDLPPIYVGAVSLLSNPPPVSLL